MVDPYRCEAWRAEDRAQRAESRGGVPDRRPGVFEHSRHSVWLLWHLNSVWCLQHLSTPSMDKWQNDREGLHFLQNIMHSEKYSNINCAEWWIPAKRCRISIVRYRICYKRCRVWDPVRPPPNLTPVCDPFLHFEVPVISLERMLRLIVMSTTIMRVKIP